MRVSIDSLIQQPMFMKQECPPRGCRSLELVLLLSLPTVEALCGGGKSTSSTPSESGLEIGADATANSTSYVTV